MPSRRESISELQASLAAALRALRDLEAQGKLPVELRPLLALAPPPELSAEVSLRYGDTDRQIKGTAASTSWTPDACGAWIAYVAEPEAALYGGTAGASGAEPPHRSESISELIRRLDQVERSPRWRFTSWTWFRDQYLPSQGWMSAHEQTQALLMELVLSGIATTSRVQNPRNPQFPVTSLTLDRRHPRVQAELGSNNVRPAFVPVRLGGRLLSEIILEERR